MRAQIPLSYLYSKYNARTSMWVVRHRGKINLGVSKLAGLKMALAQTDIYMKNTKPDTI